MSPRPTIRGFCPDLFHPLVSGDGLLVRVKPRAGRLDAAAARALGKAAAHFGSGLIDLTQRGNLQIRGLRPETVEPFACAALEAGLGARDPGLEAIRNITTTPLGRDDPLAAFDTEMAAHALEAGLAVEPALRHLPAKFGFLLDGGGLLSAHAPAADILVRAAPEGLILAGIAGTTLAARVDGGGAAAVAAAIALALAFLDLAPACTRAPRRMVDLVPTIGAPAIFAAAGLDPTDHLPQAPSGNRPPAGFLPYPGNNGATRGIFGFGIPFGQITAQTLVDLAVLAEAVGDGTLRVTQWRRILIPGVKAEAVARLATAGKAQGLIVTPGDPRLTITACAGSAGCRSASVDARRDAAYLAGQLADQLTGQASGERAEIHVSGCDKGCAHPSSAAVTLVGRGGLYDLVRDGNAQATPAEHGLSIETVARRLRAIAIARS